MYSIIIIINITKKIVFFYFITAVILQYNICSATIDYCPSPKPLITNSSSVIKRIEDGIKEQ